MKRILIVAALFLFGLACGVGEAQFNPYFLSATFTSVSTSSSTQIQPLLPSTGRHMYQIQNDANSTGSVGICWGTNNTCTAAKFAEILAPGQVDYANVSMYTTSTQPLIFNSGLFSGDIAMLAISGSVTVHVKID